ncbi:MAG: GerAB/ArcD/ProY family transporter [Oscillospiraceae bacterium]|nr:GerAB/ArcD/ProY family transporter [Oscillospiraceae bacterium]
MAKNNSYISAGLGMLLGVVFLLIILNMIKDDKNIFETNVYYFKAFGRILNFILAILAIGFAIIIFYNLTTFLNLTYLSSSSNIYIAAILAVIVYYWLSKGFNNISNAVSILFYVSLFFLVFSLFSFVNNSKTEHLFPVLAEGLKSPALGMLLFAVLSSVPVFFLLCVPRREIPEVKLKRNIIISYLIGSVGLVLIILIAILILGYPVISIFKYPEYMLLKKISIFSVIERVENIVSFQYFLDGFVLIVMCVYFAVANFKAVCKKETTKKILPAIIVFIVFGVSTFGITNANFINSFSLHYVPIILFGVIFANAVLIYVARFFEKVLSKN